mgnify:CR=1 FL=1
MKKILITLALGMFTLPMFAKSAVTEMVQGSDRQNIILIATNTEIAPASESAAPQETTEAQPAAEPKKEESKFGFFVGILILVGSAILIIMKTRGIDK